MTISIDAFRHGLSRNTNTYKFALAFCLLKHIKNNADHTPLPYAQIVEDFFALYWNHAVVYKLRHSNAEKSPPKIISIIKQYAEENELDGITFLELDRKTKTNHKQLFLRKNQGKILSLLQNPISRLPFDYNVKNESTGDPSGESLLYSWDKTKQQIVFSKNFIDLIHENFSTIHDLIVYECGLFLEKYNFTPKLLQKIDPNAEKLRETFNAEIKKLFKFTYGDLCFYCEQPLSSDDIDIDHFIPFQFTLSNDPWNLVKSCRNCNRGEGGKFNKLPDEERFIPKLILQNETLIKKSDILNKNFKTLDDLKKIIELTYQQCINAGFSIWQKQFQTKTQNIDNVIYLNYYPDLKIACGHFKTGNHQEVEKRPVPKRYGRLNPETHFLARASGNSMNGGKNPILDGQLLLLEWITSDKAGSITNETIVIEQQDGGLDNQFLLRDIRKNESGAYLLIARNSDYHEICATEDMRTRARLKGIIYE